MELFAGGAPRWLSVQAQGTDGAAALRTLLTSVPYALTAVNAGNADSLGGRPASAYVLAPSAGGGASKGEGAASGAPLTRATSPFTAGTAGTIGKFVTAVDLGDSVMTESAGRIGVGTTTPLDVLHSRFTDAGGGITGLAVQNLSGAATAYSGMLFYDHLGNLGQFQGFNNSTKEYRINNIGVGGTINFMIGGSSKFKIANSGNIGIGNASPENTLHIGSGGTPILKIDGAANTAGQGASLRWTEISSSDYGMEAFMDGAADNFVFRGILAGAVANDNILTMTPYAGNVGIGTTPTTSKVTVAGDVTISTSGDIRLNGGDFRPLGTSSDGVRWVDAGGTIQAHIHRFGAVDNRLYITNAGGANLTGVYLASGATSLTSTSDERLKTNIEPVTGILDKIKNIRVVGFNMFSSSVDKASGKAVVNREISPRVTRDGKAIKHQIGSIAQDWIKDFPELVVEPESADQFYGLDYDRIGVVALGAVKELNNLVAEKDAEIKALNARLVTLEQTLQQLTAHLEAQPRQ